MGDLSIGGKMAKYRKKSIVIEAVQFKVDRVPVPFAGEEGDVVCFDHIHGGWCIYTLEGAMTVSDGDWIIKGVKGEFYPCKPDIFDATYERVDP